MSNIRKRDLISATYRTMRWTNGKKRRLMSCVDIQHRGEGVSCLLTVGIRRLRLLLTLRVQKVVMSET